MLAARVTSIDPLSPSKVQSESERNKRRCCTIQSRREWGRFPTPGSRHHGVGFRPTELGHPVEDVTPDRCLSPLRLAVPRLQVTSEHGLVSEEAVLNAPLLSVTRLLLPLSSPALANSLKSRFTLRPWAAGGSRRHGRVTRWDHNHDVLCACRRWPDRRPICGRRPRPP